MGEAPDFVLFWDFAWRARPPLSFSSPPLPHPADRSCAAPRSLHQKPRSAEEDALFKEGLSQLHVWYGHAQTVCWMQSELPPGFAEEMEKLKLARSYEESGWCARRVGKRPSAPPVLL